MRELEAALILEQLDAICRRLGHQFPNLEEEFSSLEPALPGAVRSHSAHEGSAIREHNPSTGRLSSDFSNASDGREWSNRQHRGQTSPRRKLNPLPPVFQWTQTADASPLLSVGWGEAKGQDLQNLVERLVRTEFNHFVESCRAERVRSPTSKSHDDATPDEIGSGKECESRADSGGVTIEDKKAENGSTKDDDEEDAIWVTCSENAYGAFIYMGITTSLTQAFIKCGPMVVVSILIQAVFSVELSISLNPLDLPEQGPLTCGIPADLQFAAIMVYLCLMLNNVGSMLTAANVTLLSEEYQYEVEKEDGEEEEDGKNGNESVHSAAKSASSIKSVKIGSPWYKRFIIFVVACLSEMCTWSSILFAGIYWIITAPSVDLVIRSTVSIMFVQNVDEIIYASCCSEDIKEKLEGCSFKKVKWSKLVGVSNSSKIVDQILSGYFLFVHLPLLAATSLTVLLLVRGSDNMGCLTEPLTGWGLHRWNY